MFEDSQNKNNLKPKLRGINVASMDAATIDLHKQDPVIQV